MTSPPRLDFTAQARRDLRSILRYSLKTWGQRQRDIYADRLTDAMRELVDFPHLGRSREDISPGLRSRPVQEHVIYYRTSDEIVTVVRVLHAKMDAISQLENM